MGGTKGSHIVVDHPGLYAACAGREIFFENKDGRIVLLFPVAGRILIGTTDLPTDDPDRVECTDEEVDYFIDLVGHVFPDYPIDPTDIVYRYSGVRPLPAAGDLTPGLISRDYRVVSSTLPGGTPLISLVGGKWTTFRALGEHLSSNALELLGKARTTHTADIPIGGGKGFPQTPAETQAWVDRHRGPHLAQRVRTLLGRYGTTALDFLRHETPGEPDLEHVRGYTRSEILTLVEREHVVHLADLVYRRTNLGFTGAITEEGAWELAAIIGEALGWTASEITAERQSLA
jgi:glycerol-3-phosphate dehydrogenase